MIEGFKGLTQKIYFSTPITFFEGLELKQKIDTKAYEVYVAPLPQKQALAYLNQGLIGSLSEVITILQPSLNEEEEMPLGTSFSFQGKIWVIKQSQNWVKMGEYIRYYAFLLDDSVAQEEEWIDGEAYDG